jgi:hypothetical protein
VDYRHLTPQNLKRILEHFDLREIDGDRFTAAFGQYSKSKNGRRLRSITSRDPFEVPPAEDIRGAVERFARSDYQHCMETMIAKV